MKNEIIKHINVNIKIIVSDKMIIVAYMPSHPRLASGTHIENVQPLPPARILLKSHAIIHLLFNGNKFSQTNLLAKRKEKNWP